jgi:hypothetical protein
MSFLKERGLEYARHWCFQGKSHSDGVTTSEYLTQLVTAPIKRHTKIRCEATPYQESTVWQQAVFIRLFRSIMPETPLNNNSVRIFPHKVDLLSYIQECSENI